MRLALILVFLAGPALAAPTLVKVASFEHQVTGVTVRSDNRIFVNFPRWSEGAPISVAEWRGGKLVPYPDAEWNAWRNSKKDQMVAKGHWILR